MTQDDSRPPTEPDQAFANITPWVWGGVIVVAMILWWLLGHAAIALLTAGGLQ